MVDAATHALALGAAVRRSSVAFAIDAFSKRCLLLDVDELGYTLGHAAAIEAFEAARG